MKALQAMLEVFIQMVMSLLRLFGLGSGGGMGSNMVAKAPPKPGKDASNPAGSGESGLSLAHKMALGQIETVLAFASTAADKRKDFDLSKMRPIQQAWLRACDEKTLASLQSMDPVAALDFVLAETAKAKGAMTRHLPKETRLHLAKSNLSIVEEMASEGLLNRGRKKDKDDQQPRRRLAATPSFGLAMG